ncbi:hypothetical protein V6N11_018893 [Hibiscus sabdariffa]|uniref:Uncharacterized protein n=1 Tax=Hibiscus sabdariffa TaxID=183260 RepID=A0ABR2R0V1_9ROSI
MNPQRKASTMTIDTVTGSRFASLQEQAIADKMEAENLIDVELENSQHMMSNDKLKETVGSLGMPIDSSHVVKNATYRESNPDHCHK